MIFRNKLFDFISFLAVTALAVAPVRLVAENGPVTVLTGPLPPYSYQENNDYKGLLTDIFLELSTKRNLKYKLTSKPWPRAISESKKDGPLSTRLLKQNIGKPTTFGWVP